MPYFLAVFIVIFESFMLGSIPFGVIIAHKFFHADPRQGGSGSIGATNMKRLFGMKAALFTFLGDVAKGACAVALARLLIEFCAFNIAWQIQLLLIIAVFCSILGHMFSPWLRFKGGKGISTGLGSILVAFPPSALSILAVFLLLALLTRRVSVGSICAALAFPFTSWLFYPDSPVVIFFAALVALVVCFAHRSNIARIMTGTEPIFSFNNDNDKGST